MAWLAINGVPLAVRTEGAGITMEDVGEGARAEDGTLLIDRRATKRTFEVDLPLQQAEAALWLRDLAIGRFDVWRFNGSSGLYSSKGRAAVLGGTTSLNTGLAGRWENGRIVMPAGNPQTLTFPIDITNGATVFAWSWTGTVWQLEVAWFDGGTVPATGWWKASTAGVVSGTLLDDTSWAGSGNYPALTANNGPLVISTVMIVQRSLRNVSTLDSDAWSAGIAMTQRGPPLAPRLHLTGDVIDPNTTPYAPTNPPYATCVGRVDSTKILPSRRAGEYRTNDHALSLKFEEV